VKSTFSPLKITYPILEESLSNILGNKDEQESPGERLTHTHTECSGWLKETADIYIFLQAREDAEPQSSGIK
jgi:hypothetical protein